MTYFQVVVNDIVIGAGTTGDLRKYQAKHGILLTATEDDAQYIQIDQELYRDTWFKKITSDIVSYMDAEVTVVDEDTYNELVTALESGDEITVDNYEDYTEEEITVDEETGEETTTTTKLSDRVAELEEQLATALEGYEEAAITSEAVLELAELVADTSEELETVAGAVMELAELIAEMEA